MSVEALLGGAYAVFLVLAALGLDRLARHSHNRSGRYRTAGFTYRLDLDAWVCPEGEHLRRVETDHDSRLVRYQARALVCNRCPVKDDCTDSRTGRELVRPLDPWPHSEAGRFHRGIAVAMVVLATLIVALALARNHRPDEVVVLVPVGGLVLAVLGRLLSSFRRAPTGFPGETTPLGSP